MLWFKKEVTPTMVILLNSIIYDTDFEKNKIVGMSVYDWAKQYYFKRTDENHNPGGITKKEFEAIIETIKKEKKVYKKIKILELDNEIAGNKAGTTKVVNAIFQYGNNFIFVFKGTAGALEWRDNGECVYLETLESLQQKRALAFFDKSVEKYDKKIKNIIVSGHSKGGNKAQYIGVLRGDLAKIKVVYSLNGMGFNRTFFSTYANQIKLHAHKIVDITNEFDYVNAIMRTVSGKVIYLKSSAPFSRDGQYYKHILTQFDKWHSLYALLHEENGVLVMNDEVGMSEEIRKIRNVLHFYLDNLNAEDTRFLFYRFASNMMKQEAKNYGEDYSKIPLGFLPRFILLTHQLFKTYDDIKLSNVIYHFNPFLNESEKKSLVKEIEEK